MRLGLLVDSKLALRKAVVPRRSIAAVLLPRRGLGLSPRVRVRACPAYIACAAVAGDAEHGLLTAFSFGAKSPADTVALLQGLGKVTARRADAVEIQTPSGEHGWFMPVRDVILFADSEIALVGAGNLAIE